MEPRPQRCNQCGTPIPGDADTLGLCPACLIRRAMGKGAALGFEPPSIDEVQSELAQLDVLELVGFGGMGVVYKARQRSLDRLVAVKVFPRERWDDEAFEARFRREARLLASLSHPHIVTAHEYGETDAYYYFLMELVRGRSLRELLRDGPVPRDEALRIASEACQALEHAHGHGVVHRDIKPENILIETGGRVRVADFGLAKLIGAGEGEPRLGTPEYMAPEQRDHPDAVDARADVYAVGVVLHEMLTGRLPTTPAADLPGPVGRIIRKCLTPDPAARYARIADLRRDLDHLRTRRHRLLVPVLIGTLAFAILAGALWWFPRAAQQREDARWPDPLARLNAPPSSRPAFPTTRPPWAPPDMPRPPVPSGPVTTFRLDGVPPNSTAQIMQRLRELGASGVYTSTSGDRMTALVHPAGDTQSWAAKVNFGTVTKTDDDARVIYVRLDPAKLPAPHPPAVTNPSDPNYYPQNLADLQSWDPQRRRNALTRLKRTDPTPLAADVRRALADIATNDTDHFLRRDAIDALAAWPGPESVVALESLRWDESTGLSRTAAEALEEIGEQRIAALLTHPDKATRLAAIRVLRETGTARSLLPLGQAAGSGDPEIEQAADAALRDISRRIDNR